LLGDREVPWRVNVRELPAEFTGHTTLASLSAEAPPDSLEEEKEEIVTW
jgi:hypothetical protein